MKDSLKVPDKFNDPNKVYAWASEYIRGVLQHEEIDRVKSQGWEDCNHRADGLYLVSMDKDKYELLKDKLSPTHKYYGDPAFSDSEHAMRHFEVALKYYKKVKLMEPQEQAIYDYIIHELSNKIMNECFNSVTDYIDSNREEQLKPEYMMDTNSDRITPFKRRKGDSHEKS